MVQHILDSGTGEQDEQADKIDGGTRVIDLSDDEMECPELEVTVTSWK